MIPLNFYKIRTGLDIRPLLQGGDQESQLRYDQLLQTIGQKSEIEFLSSNVLIVEEKSPADLKYYQRTKVVIYILIFALNKNTSSWTATDLKQSFGNLQITKKIKDLNEYAFEWIGGAEANISCEAALFDLRTKKKR